MVITIMVDDTVMCYMRFLKYLVTIFSSNDACLLKRVHNIV
jgi:hypothetical protein